VCARDGDFSCFSVPPLDGDKRQFHQSAVKTYFEKKSAILNKEDIFTFNNLYSANKCTKNYIKV